MKRKVKGRSIEDIMQICEQSYDKTHEFGDQLGYALWFYDMRLVDYYESIREAQPKRHGAVLLQLDKCGRGCLGCPHPRWVKWVNRNEQDPINPPTWFAAPVRNPSASARAKHIPDRARLLISEAQVFLRQRASFIAAMARLRRVLAGQMQHEPDLKHDVETLPIELAKRARQNLRS